MTRLLLAAAVVLAASPALAQQSRFQPPPQNRFLAQPGPGGLQGRQQPVLAPRPGGRLITDNGAGLISNGRGGIVGDHGGGFRPR